MKILLYSAATSLVLTFLLMPLFVKFLMRIQILDKGGRRKIHKGTIPSMGGIIIFISFLLAMIFWQPFGVLGEGRFVTAALMLMALIGIRDDIVPLPAMIKLLVQIVAASMVVVVADVKLVSFYGLFGIYDLAPWLSYFLSIMFIIFVTNAFNLIDGVDGLAGTIAFFAFSFLSLWNYWVGNIEVAVFLACFVGALLGFLYYNWQPASIFMGDTGSLPLGFVLAVFTLEFITFNGALPAESTYKFHAVLSAGVAIVLLPVFDTTRVFLLRLSQKRSPFNPDKQHTHHAVMRKVQTHAKTVRIMVFTYLLIAGIVLFISWKGWVVDWVLLLGLLAVLILIDYYLVYLLTHLHKDKSA